MKKERKRGMFDEATYRLHSWLRYIGVEVVEKKGE